MKQENFIEVNDSIDLMAEIRYYLFFWPWYLACILLMLLGSFLYLRYSQTFYATTATLQVKDPQSDPSDFITQGNAAMFDFNQVKIDNYIGRTKKNTNLQKVVMDLDLTSSVYKKGRIKDVLLYANEIPFDLKFKSDITISSISVEFEKGGGVLSFNDKDYSFKNNEVLDFEFFSFKAQPNTSRADSYIINRIPTAESAARLLEVLEVSSKSEEGDNINLSLSGSNYNRSEAILNKLIEVAHDDQISDKQEVYGLSINFINKRLKTFKAEIDSLSLKTTDFKSENAIFSPEEQTKFALSSINSLDEEDLKFNTQLELSFSLKQIVQNQIDFSLLPSNIGIANADVNQLVNSYNTLVLERKNLLSGATQKNPLVLELSSQLKALKQNIIESIDNYSADLQTSLSNFKEFSDAKSSEMAKIPVLEATLTAFQRRFEIAQNIYLFLLQRREEAAIRYESTVPDTRVINFASTNPIPTAPNKKLIVLGSLFMALLLPTLVLYILKLIDTKLHTREDLEKSLPSLAIMGEVPFVSQLGTTKDSRGIFAESARVIRSNISFKLVGEGSKVILSTSSIKGEGKTMSAFNIAASYAATGKKVLMVGADLRNPRLHDILEIERLGTEKGLSSFLVSNSNEVISDHIFSIDIFNSKMDVLLSGPIPPNPAELLGSKKFESVLNTLKENYDYIIIDSAPLVLVSDTLPLLKYADLTLYTTRAHHTEKKLTDFIKGLVNDKKVKNIGLIFNGVKTGGSSYWKYGYSYRYSYQYKYNFGYGYGYEEETNL